MPFKIFNQKIFFSKKNVKKYLLKNKNLYYTTDYKKRNIEKNKIFLSKFDYDLDYNFLYFIAGLSLQRKEISVLDFGAGVGNTYIKYRKKGFSKKNIIYSIFDQNKDLTKSAKKMIKENFKNIKNLNIIYDFKSITYHDAIHFGSMFEYVEDYKILIKKIFNQMNKKPEYLFISDLFGTNQKNFYLIANYYGHKYFVKFHNLKNLISEFKKLNYKLIYKNPHLPNIKGKFQFFDMSNLQKKFQISHTWNLFFQYDDKR